MNDINKVFLIGRLTRDAEAKYTASGTAICNFGLAVNRSVKKEKGWEDEGNFFEIRIWGKMAENLVKFLQKGKKIAVLGELRQNRWEKDGQKFSKVEIIAGQIQLLGSKEESAHPDGPESLEPPVEPDSFEDEEIPF